MANYARFQPFMTGLMLHLLLTTLSKMMLNKPSNQYKQMTARYPPSTRLSSWRPKRKSYLPSKSILWLMMSTTLSNVIIAKKVSKANRSSLYILEYILERVSHTYFNSFIVLNLKNTVTFQSRISVQKWIVGGLLLNPGTYKPIWKMCITRYARFQQFMTDLKIILRKQLSTKTLPKKILHNQRN